MITIALFNNKGGVGKTTLAYHLTYLTYMFQRLGYGVLAVDLDPQANLTSAFFDDDTLEKVWDENVFGRTVLTCVQPILDGTGDIAPAVPLRMNPVDVLCGDLGLSRFEDKLSESWPKGFANDQAALRATPAFYRMIQDAGVRTYADIALVDGGPNLGAINRSALLAADFLRQHQDSLKWVIEEFSQKSASDLQVFRSLSQHCQLALECDLPAAMKSASSMASTASPRVQRWDRLSGRP